MSALMPLIIAMRAEAAALVDEADGFERADMRDLELMFRALANAKFEAAGAIEANAAGLEQLIEARAPHLVAGPTVKAH